MPAAGNVFVTPHAVRQFQRRIAPLPYHAALAAIIHGVTAVPAAAWRVTANGAAVCVRVRRPFQFRALLQAGEGAYPAVVTILKSGKRGANRKRLEAYRHATATH